ncbi:tripartite tricarboxylate transporter permease [Marinobacterium rhizophilum]|uniref:Tripartite tricarboxylate transporter permease n=1 Tax=Marinobacterium rhizophilum TaxID=420402 RepID=A0ABY5HLA9_9GAMM|nr:tripartite tricarboxylate transporter permease [Marinobacterium rhizophilum]UTW12592.1 tripartite tricarboxylate transporter permease [Marinobacterium rhizophilum]
MDSLITALLMLATPAALMAVAGGTLFGILVGALPGLGSVLGITVILPFTYMLDQTTSIALLLGTYCGSVYGGSISAILINTPGTPQSAATVLDGYPMARSGRPALALGWATVASTFGGLLACGILIVAAPALARFGLRFGPIEYFALGLFALSCIVSVARESLLKGVLAGVFGLFLATVGQDPVTGAMRFDYGSFELSAGISLVPLLVGLFAVSEVLWRIAGPAERGGATIMKAGFELPGWAALRQRFWLMIKSALIGTGIGTLPGIGATAASLVSYADAKRTSPRRDKFGSGEPDGIVASESANNAVTAGALVPTLSLGVPGDPVTAVMLGALTIQNITPGPRLFSENGDLVTYLFLALIAVNLAMFVLGALLAPAFSRLLKLPEPLLMASVVVLVTVGTYSVNSSAFDLGIVLLAGLVGFVLRWLAFPLAPVVIGFVLSPMIEGSLRQGMILTGDNFWAFGTSPIAAVLFVLTGLFLLWPLYGWWRGRQRSGASANPVSGD